jgi:hypothetical protein
MLATPRRCLAIHLHAICCICHTLPAISAPASSSTASSSTPPHLQLAQVPPLAHSRCINRRGPTAPGCCQLLCCCLAADGQLRCTHQQVAGLDVLVSLQQWQQQQQQQQEHARQQARRGSTSMLARAGHVTAAQLKHMHVGKCIKLPQHSVNINVCMFCIVTCMDAACPRRASQTSAAVESLEIQSVTV